MLSVAPPFTSGEGRSGSVVIRHRSSSSRWSDLSKKLEGAEPDLNGLYEANLRVRHPRYTWNGTTRGRACKFKDPDPVG